MKTNASSCSVARHQAAPTCWDSFWPGASPTNRNQSLLKRAIERHLTQPIALQLAALQPGDFSAVRVYPGPDRLAVHVQTLEQAEKVSPPPIDLADPETLLGRLRATLRRVDDDIAALRPTGPITLGQVPPEQYRYFILREQADLVRAELRKLGEKLEATRTSQRSYPSYRPARRGRGARAE